MLDFLKKTRGMFFFFVVLFTVTCIPVSANEAQEPYIDIDYGISIEQPILHVIAEFNNIKTDKLVLSFTDSEAGIDGLLNRMKELKVFDGSQQQSLPFRECGKGLYEIDTKQRSSIIITYDFDPQAAEHNHNLSILTSSYVHLAGPDFLAQVFENQKAAEDNGNSIGRRYKIKFENLPDHWKVLDAYPISSDGGILLDSSEVLVHAGNYKTEDVPLKNGKLTIAVDSEIQFDAEPFVNGIKKIMNYYSDIFGRMPQSNALLVINQSRGKFNPGSTSMGGQVKGQNVLTEIGGINKGNQQEERGDLIGLFAHELFHIWVSCGFNVTQEWSWFWEGFTEYQSMRVPLKLGLISQDEYNRKIYDKFISYKNLAIKNKVSLIDASTRKFDTDSEYSSLIYDKGTLLAYAFDKKLKQSGKDFDAFLGDLYQEVAIPGIPADNKTIVGFMDQYTGDPSFTSKYVTGTETLPISPMGDFGPEYYYQLYLKPYSPPLPFPFNLLVPLLVIAAVVWGGIWGIGKIKRGKVRQSI